MSGVREPTRSFVSIDLCPMHPLRAGNDPQISYTCLRNCKSGNKDDVPEAPRKPTKNVLLDNVGTTCDVIRDAVVRLV